MRRKTPMELRRERITARVLGLLSSSGKALIIDEMARSLHMRRQSILECLNELLKVNVIARSGVGVSGKPFYYMLVSDFARLNETRFETYQNDEKIMEEFTV